MSAEFGSDALPRSCMSPCMDQGTQCEEAPQAASFQSTIIQRIRAERTRRSPPSRSKSVRRDGQRTHRREHSVVGTADSYPTNLLKVHRAGGKLTCWSGTMGIDESREALSGATAVSVVGERVPGMAASEEQVAAFWSELLPLRIGAEWHSKQHKLQAGKREVRDSPSRRSPSPVPLLLKPLDNPPFPPYSKKRRVYYKPRAAKDLIENRANKRPLLQLDGKRQALIRLFPSPQRLQRAGSP